jgi:hypothetical protein
MNNSRINTLYSTERDAALLALRPHIAAVDAEKVRSNAPNAPAEAFLHHTLRPVLKLHNAVLLDVCATYCVAHRSTLLQASRAQQQMFVQNALKRDAALRNTVIGVVVGNCTGEEMSIYRAHRAELNKRIIELAAKRVADQITIVIDHLQTAPPEHWLFRRL